MLHPTSRVLAALAEPTDAELLARFVADRDTTAFELLVWRHAGLVLRVCRGVLRDHHAAEDATQAVFLALARQAPSVRHAGSPAGWLFRVARRVSARACRHRRVTTVPPADLDGLPAALAVQPDSESERVLHEELAKLPESYRVLILLCFFEGLTHVEAARRLGVPVGTVAGRMARAKEALASRLARRGVTGVVLAPLVFTVTPSFAAATTRVAVAFSSKNNQCVPATVLVLARQELKMTLAKKVLSLGVLVVAVFGCLAFGVRLSAEPPPTPAPAPSTSRVAATDKAPVAKPPNAVVGKTFALAPLTTDLQRRLIDNAGPNSTALLVVDASALFKNASTLDIEAIQLGELQKALKALQPEKGKSVAHFAVHYSITRDISTDGQLVLHFALEGAARSAGFVPGTTVGHKTCHPTFEFDQYVAPLKADKDTDLAETGVGDERVLAYPVRTPLSRVLTQSAAGVVDVRVPLECQADDWLPVEVDKSVKAALGKLKLAKGQQVNFMLNIPKQDDSTQQRVQERVRAACRRWAEDGGLEMGSITY
jgi:RNA polymerase sigma factor (sigma-70 family)